MAFDECPPYPAEREYILRSLERTERWLARCLTVKSRPEQALFAIVQGGVHEDLRERSLALTLPYDTLVSHWVDWRSVNPRRRCTRRWRSRPGVCPSTSPVT